MPKKSPSSKDPVADIPKSRPASRAKSTPPSANAQEKIQKVTTQAKKTATKVASAVKETVKDIAEKVTKKATTKKSPAASKSRPAGTLDGAAARKAASKAPAKPAPRASKATKIGALTSDITSQDVLESIVDSHSSDTVTADVKENFLKDQALQAGGPPPPQPPRHLPEEYGDTRLVLLIRDPEWVFAYWEINDETRRQMNLPRSENRRMALRMFKISGRDWPNQAAHYFFDVDVDANARSWYIHLPEPNESWCAELGVFDDSQNFQPICRSNYFITPRTSISDEVDSEWMTVEESFEKITRISGAGATLEARLRGEVPTASESILRHIHKQITGVMQGERPTLSSSIFSSESAIGAPVQKDFWLQVNTELILYGATEPDATVTVQGKPISLNPDGTFSLRYALPDGQQTLEVHAVKSTKDMEETITPVVTRHTI